ncbi:hypothetical protein CANINC_001754 [Pichia inconspicua]|uniref:C3H1-type domain-containing protein n=1 Tax=Pichia inconspicua TaxID=52247 RepID=A0A4T0X383_9ASCO|nr:hypothetical protein CANINC_001754 [[Candida] inconspicua]
MKRKNDSNTNYSEKLQKVVEQAVLPPKPIFSKSNVDSTNGKSLIRRNETNTSIEVFPGMELNIPQELHTNKSITTENSAETIKPPPEALHLFNSLVETLNSANASNLQQPFYAPTVSNLHYEGYNQAITQTQTCYGTNYYQDYNQNYYQNHPNYQSYRYNSSCNSQYDPSYYQNLNYSQAIHQTDSCKNFNNVLTSQQQLPTSGSPIQDTNQNGQLFSMFSTLLQQQKQRQQQQQQHQQQHQQPYLNQFTANYQHQQYHSPITQVPENLFSQNLSSGDKNKYNPQNSKTEGSSGLAYPSFKRTGNGDKNNRDHERCQKAKIGKPKNFADQIKDDEHDNSCEEEEDEKDFDEDDEAADEELNTKVAVPGTNIILENEEDIERWIEERKKNWPTAKRVKEKMEEKEKAEKIMKNLTGEIIEVHYTPKIKVCNFWMRTKRCKNGKNCKFSHDATEIADYKTNIKENHKNRRDSKQSFPNHKTKLIHGIPVQIPQRFTPLSNKGKSLHSLIVEGEQFQNENVELITLFEKLVKFQLLNKDWEGLKKKIKLDDESLSMQ